MNYDENQNQIFVHNFFLFQNPIFLETEFSEQELKNNDIKISLEIATKSYLRMQSDPKTNLISFSCKIHGKNCYEIFGFKRDKSYLIQTDYTKVVHKSNCQLSQEFFEYLKIYNLMKLKKNLIEDFMLEKRLMHSSPSQILCQIGREEQYFFQKNIKYNQQLRKKLRKRFDNIVNIDIKKITKGGRQQVSQTPKQERQILKQIDKQQNTNRNISHLLSLGPEQASFFNEKKTKEKKQKIKKKQKKITKKDKKHNSKTQRRKINHRSLSEQKEKSQMNDDIYSNPNSQSELKQIKELKRQFNGFDDIFPWQFDAQIQPVQPQTINDKVRQSLFQSLRYSLIKRSLQIKSVSQFPEQIQQFHKFHDEQD